MWGLWFDICVGNFVTMCVQSSMGSDSIAFLGLLLDSIPF